MLWVGIIITVLVAVTLVRMLATRSRNDLGFLSDRWVSEHCADVR